MLMTRPVVAAMLFGTAMSAHADQLLLTFDGIGASRHLAIGFNSLLSSDSNASITFLDPTLVGESNWRNQQGSKVITYSTRFDVSHRTGDTLAFGLLNDLQGSDFTSEQEMLSNTQTGLLEDLYCRYINLCSGELALDTQLVDTFDFDTAASAIQLAIWEITQESLSESSLAIAKSELSLQVGAFRAHSTSDYSDASTEEAAAFVLSSLGKDGWHSTQGSLKGLSSQGSLNQLMVVPLPIPAILAGTGLAFLFVSRRRRRQHVRSS